MNLIIPIIVLVIMLFLKPQSNFNKIGGFGHVEFMKMLYLVISVSSLINFFLYRRINAFDIALFPMLFFSIALIIVFFGFNKMNYVIINNIYIDNIFMYKRVKMFIIFGNIFAILFFIPFAIIALQGDIRFNRDDMIATGETAFGVFGLINTIATVFPNLLFLVLLMLFIENTSSENKKRLQVFSRFDSTLLLISSTSFVIYIFAYVGRDGFVYWMLTYGFMFFLFRRNITSVFKAKFIKSFIIISILFFIPFIWISLSRFGNTGVNIVYELFNYIGQQLINFNDIYFVDFPYQYGNKNFPVIVNFFRNLGLEIPQKLTSYEFNSYFMGYGIESWTFSTYIGSFYQDFGPIFTLVILFFIALITRRLTKRTKITSTISFSNLVLYLLLCQATLWGVFYFRLSTLNNYILLVLIIYFLFRIPAKGVNLKI